jgi:pilus assembly protein CpaF
VIPELIYETTIRRFLSPIEAMLADASVTEIMINGPHEVFVERRGKIVKIDAVFSSFEALMSALRVVAQYVGRPFDEANPLLEARLPDGSRVAALMPPVAPNGPCVAIRRFSKQILTINRLIEFGALTDDAVETLRVLVEAKSNIVVSGGTGSGKTSMLNAISALIPAEERLIVIEDSRELMLQREHVISLEARPPDTRGKGTVSVRDLFRTSLRMRPDRIILGEIRAGEALDLIQAMTSGHGGCLATVHASYPKDTLSRLETLALMGGVELPLYALRSQLASAVDFVVQTARFRDGRRMVTHISEVTGADPQQGYSIVDLFATRVFGKSADGATHRVLEPTGYLPTCMPALQAQGVELPRNVMVAAQRLSASGRI